MAVTMTYSSLVGDLQSYCERGGSNDALTYAQIPSIINRAERVLGRMVKIMLMCNPVISAFAGSTNTYQKPDRWRETISLNFGSGTSNNTRNPVFPRSYEYIRTVFPDDTQTGAPQFYAEYDYEHFVVAPTPDQAYPFELNYYQLPPYLADTNQTNWWTDYAPELLFAASMLELTKYLRDDPRIAIWQQDFQTLLDAINTEDMEKIVDRTTSRRKA